MNKHDLNVSVTKSPFKLAWTLSLLCAAGCGTAHDIDPAGSLNDANAETSISRANLTAAARIFRAQKNTGMCLQPQGGSTANGTLIVLGECNNSSQQIWLHPDTSFRVGDNKCLDVSGGANKNGTTLQIWDCDSNNNNQKFIIGNKALKWQGTDKCLDVSGGIAEAGTTIQIWQCGSNNTNQQWDIKSVASASASQTRTSTTVAADTAQSTTATSGDTSGYLKTSGTQIVDQTNKPVYLRGTNIGGWLVTEGWMNGYTDASDKDPFRFSLETLEKRFGTAQAKELINVWYDKFITTQDLDTIKDIGLNTLRVPFGYRNLQNADTSWIKNSSGKIDFSRLDWIVDEASKRGLYVILDFHIWDSQKSNYSLISENTDAGHASLAKAQAIWTEVAKHFKGNATIAAFDVINEPTGSWGNLMQDGLYKAVRAVDADRIIVMESMSANPASMGWSQVAYSIHQYNMMGNDFGANKTAFQSDLNGSIRSFSSYNIPTYIGEFMVQESGETLGWLLGQYNSNKFAWTNWTYKTANMGAWGLCNLPSSVHVDLLNDSFDTIKSTWENIPACTPEANVVSAFKAALGN